MNKNFAFKSVKLFREKLFYFLFYDVLFFVSMFILFVFIRLKLYQYNTLLEQFGPLLGSFTSENLDPLILQQTLDQINAIANRALLFIYTAVPAGIFLIWSFFQGSSWQLLSGKKRFDFKYLIRFAAVTIPFFIILGFAATNLIKLSSELFIDYTILFRMEIWIYLALAILTTYMMLVAYSDLNLKNLLKNFKTAIKRIYLMFPVCLILILLFFALIVNLTYLYIIFFAGIYTSNFITALILSLVFLVLFIYFKIILFNFFNKVLEKSK